MFEQISITCTYIYILIFKKNKLNLSLYLSLIPFSEEYSTSETMDSFEEEKEQLTREISNNQGLYYESNDTKDRERI